MPETYAGEERCWPCTVANATVGLIIAWLPLVAVFVDGASSLVALAIGWGVVVTGFTLYQLVQRGYLPLAEPVAKATGLHERIGPGSTSDSDEK